jgi:hypothetical protein
MVETLFLTGFLSVDNGSMPISQAWPLFAMMTVVELKLFRPGCLVKTLTAIGRKSHIPDFFLNTSIELDSNPIGLSTN